MNIVSVALLYHLHFQSGALILTICLQKQHTTMLQCKNGSSFKKQICVRLHVSDFYSVRVCRWSKAFWQYRGHTQWLCVSFTDHGDIVFVCRHADIKAPPSGPDTSPSCVPVQQVNEEQNQFFCAEKV